MTGMRQNGGKLRWLKRAVWHPVTGPFDQLWQDGGMVGKR
jgi:hypothetical protein